MKYILNLCFVFISISSYSQYLSGIIKDNRSKQGIPYVNIGIPSKAFGIISNDDGSFKFKLTDEKQTDTIQISSIGYQTILLSLEKFKNYCETNESIYLDEVVYELATTTVRPNEYETTVLGFKNVDDLKCMNLDVFVKKDSLTLQKFKEKGLSEKAIGIEIGNKIKIDNGQQTFIDKIQFKTCLGTNDTAIYRVNIYSEGKILQRMLSPIGIIKVINTNNILKSPVILKTVGKTEVHSVDLSAQNIEVTDDFVIALECIYASNSQMNIGVDPSIFGSTDLLMRTSIIDEWIKVPLVDITFISATVTYKKKKSLWNRLFN